MSRNRQPSNPGRTIRHTICAAAVLTLAAAVAPAQETSKAQSPAPTVSSPMDVLSSQQWREVETSVDRALAWLATRQQANGSFSSPDSGQPGITALCVLAFLSRGHLPDQGPYGSHLRKAVDFVLSCQKDNGLLTYQIPGPTHQSRQASHAATYNHAISSVMLCEVYGMAGEKPARSIRVAIDRALAFTVAHQKVVKRRNQDKGGWRYLRRFGDNTDSDLSITSWQLMFLRAAKNAGFEVPSETVEEGIKYVERCGAHRDGTFRYGLGSPNDESITWAMAGAGILSLSMAGRHDTPLARQAGDWLLRQPFHIYKPAYTTWTRYNRYHYSMFYCSQAMYQLGGDHWRLFYPRMTRTLLANQQKDGSWEEENGADNYFGNSYTTALAVMALSVPYQVLPIFQR
ncbi:MAG: terpene cyclase/mutase family protein [Planctomycetes bacterium]|nr:terpene cyclase/mutase family protein [Planctomycetota bacterium]